MREIQTLGTRQIATALVKREEGSNPNIAPDAERVNDVTQRLDEIVKTIGETRHQERWDASALTTTQAERVQTAWLASPAEGDLAKVAL